MKIPANWTFKSTEVAAGFDRHVREQLPWYDLTTSIVAHMGRHYIPTNGIVYDIGASTGNIGNALAETMISRDANFFPIDNSPAMGDVYAGPAELIIADALEYEFENFDFAVCFLVVMFMPVSERREWVRRMCQKIKPGGALLIFDKCIPGQGYVSTAITRMALASKMASGVPAEEILAKEMSLAGVQRPIDPLSVIPPNAREVFRFGDFAGWIIERFD